MMKTDHKKYFALLAEKLQEITKKPLKIMEVCGTHTMAIGKSGIRRIIPPEIHLISGPGCPVCVTADKDIDAFLRLAQTENVIIATYGDMIRVPGSEGSLAEMKAHGADVRVVYSALEALQIARQNSTKEVIFLGVGFETTTPATAHALKLARHENLINFSVFNMHKTVPQALRVLLEDENCKIDGFILPGHVSAIIGEKPYAFLAEEYKVAGVITGFEAPEIMAGLVKLVQDIQAGKASINNLYRHVVHPDGNLHAQKLIDEVFELADAEWRGIGIIPDSGLKIRDEYSDYDAEKKFAVEKRAVKMFPGCRCGEILKGTIKPLACPLFMKHCTPEKPVGPCMVSSEGTCAAYYLYEGADASE